MRALPITAPRHDRDLLIEIRDRVARIEAWIDRQDAARGPRDDADRALLVALAESLKDHAFTSAQALRLSEADEGRRDALLAADIDSPRELGWVLRRQGACEREAVWVERVGTDRDGILWRMRVSSCE